MRSSTHTPISSAPSSHAATPFHDRSLHSTPRSTHSSHPHTLAHFQRKNSGTALASSSSTPHLSAFPSASPSASHSVSHSAAPTSRSLLSPLSPAPIHEEKTILHTGDVTIKMEMDKLPKQSSRALLSSASSLSTPPTTHSSSTNPTHTNSYAHLLNVQALLPSGGEEEIIPTTPISEFPLLVPPPAHLTIQQKLKLQRSQLRELRKTGSIKESWHSRHEAQINRILSMPIPKRKVDKYQYVHEYDLEGLARRRDNMESKMLNYYTSIKNLHEADIQANEKAHKLLAMKQRQLSTAMTQKVKSIPHPDPSTLSPTHTQHIDALNADMRRAILRAKTSRRGSLASIANQGSQRSGRGRAGGGDSDNDVIDGSSPTLPRDSANATARTRDSDLLADIEDIEDESERRKLIERRRGEREEKERVEKEEKVKKEAERQQHILQIQQAREKTRRRRGGRGGKGRRGGRRRSEGEEMGSTDESARSTSGSSYSSNSDSDSNEEKRHKRHNRRSMRRSQVDIAIAAIVQQEHEEQMEEPELSFQVPLSPITTPPLSPTNLTHPLSASTHTQTRQPISLPQLLKSWFEHEASLLTTPYNKWHESMAAERADRAHIMVLPKSIRTEEEEEKRLELKHGIPHTRGGNNKQPAMSALQSHDKPVHTLSPRTSYSHEQSSLLKHLVQLLMQLDQQALDSIRAEFILHDELHPSKQGLVLFDFVLLAQTYLNCTGTAHDMSALMEMFREIDVNQDQLLEWEEFTAHLVQLANTYGVDKAVEDRPHFKLHLIEPERHSRPIDGLYYISGHLKKLICLERDSRLAKVYTPDFNCIKTVRARAAILALEYITLRSQICMSCADRTLQFWDLSSSAQFTLNCTWNLLQSLTALRYYAANNVLYSGDIAGKITQWNIERGEEKMTFIGHTDAIMDMCIIPPFNLLASCSLDCSIRTWEMSKGGSIHVFVGGHNKPPLCLAYHTELKLLLSAGLNRYACAWDLGQADKSQPIQRLYSSAQHTHIIGMQIMPNSYDFILADNAGTFKVYDLRTYVLMQQFAIAKLEKGYGLTSVCFLAHLGLLVGGGMKLYGFKRTTGVLANRADDDPIHFVQFDPFSLNFLTASSTNFKVYTSLSGQLLREEKNFTGNPITITACCLDTPCRRLYVGTSSGRLYVVNISNGGVLGSVVAHSSEVSCICYEDRADGESRVISGSWDGSVVWCDDLLGSVQRRNTDHKRDVLFVASAVEYGLVVSAGADCQLLCYDEHQMPVSHRWTLAHVPTSLCILHPYPLLFLSDTAGGIALYDLSTPLRKSSLLYISTLALVPTSQPSSARNMFQSATVPASSMASTRMPTPKDSARATAEQGKGTNSTVALSSHATTSTSAIHMPAHGQHVGVDGTHVTFIELPPSQQTSPDPIVPLATQDSAIPDASPATTTTDSEYQYYKVSLITHMKFINQVDKKWLLLCDDAGYFHLIDLLPALLYRFYPDHPVPSPLPPRPKCRYMRDSYESVVVSAKEKAEIKRIKEEKEEKERQAALAKKPTLDRMHIENEISATAHQLASPHAGSIGRRATLTIYSHGRTNSLATALPNMPHLPGIVPSLASPTSPAPPPPPAEYPNLIEATLTSRREQIVIENMREWKERDEMQFRHYFSPFLSLHAHADSCDGAGFIPHSKPNPTIYTWAFDGTVRLWDAITGERIGALMQGHNERQPERPASESWEFYYDLQVHRQLEHEFCVRSFQKPEPIVEDTEIPLSYLAAKLKYPITIPNIVHERLKEGESKEDEQLLLMPGQEPPIPKGDTFITETDHIHATTTTSDTENANADEPVIKQEEEKTQPEESDSQPIDEPIEQSKKKLLAKKKKPQPPSDTASDAAVTPAPSKQSLLAPPSVQSLRSLGGTPTFSAKESALHHSQSLPVLYGAYSYPISPPLSIASLPPNTLSHPHAQPHPHPHSHLLSVHHPPLPFSPSLPVHALPASGPAAPKLVAPWRWMYEDAHVESVVESVEQKAKEVLHAKHRQEWNSIASSPSLSLDATAEPRPHSAQSRERDRGGSASPEQNREQRALVFATPSSSHTSASTRPVSVQATTPSVQAVQTIKESSSSSKKASPVKKVKETIHERPLFEMATLPPPLLTRYKSASLIF